MKTRSISPRRLMITAGLLMACFQMVSFCPISFSVAEEVNYCVAIGPCPVLNLPDLGEVFGAQNGVSVKVDEKGLIRAMEFIALPGTTFSIVSEIPKDGHRTLEVITPDYPSENPLFIDSRFVTFVAAPPSPREKTLLPAGKILSSLKAMSGQPYMWGGNYANGIPLMTELYPPSGKISAETLSLWQLEGVDCSGLIYQASGGYTPRNTSGMLDFGKSVKISGLSAEEISRKTAPLDLIVWPGHVVIVLDKNTAIESSLSRGGVVMSGLTDRLRSIMSERVPADKWHPSSARTFVIRRWHDKN